MIRGGQRVALAGVLALVTLVAFEAMAVATAMPVVASALGGLRHYGLAFSLFLTTSLLGMVVAGTWNDVRGPTAPVLAGLGAFAGGSLVSGLAPDFPVLLVGRAVAGLGGGVLVVTLYVVVGALFPAAARPRVFAWLSGAWVLPSVVGPPLAGWLAQDVTWRAVFLLVVPLAAATPVVLLPRLARLGPGGGAADGAATTAPGEGRRRLVAGVVLAGGAAVAQTASADLQPLRVLPVAATALGVVAVAVALPRLVPRGTLRLRRGLPSVVAARGLFTACFTGAEAYVPLMLVTERGLSPTQAGFALTGAALGWTGGSVLVGARGRWALPLPRHRLMALAGVLVAVAVGLLALPALHLVPGALVLADWALGGLGMGLGLSSTGVLVLAMAPQDERGRDSAALQLSDALGSVLGIGAGAAVLAARSGAGERGHALAGVFAGLAVVGLLAALAGSRVRPRAVTSEEVAQALAPASELPDPDLPDPELPDPELPDPELPDPELPDPELPDGTGTAPARSSSASVAGS